MQARQSPDHPTPAPDAVRVDAKVQINASEFPRVAQNAYTRQRSRQDPALRRRMRRQAQLMVLVALLVLFTAFSVPFVLHYLDITIP